MGERRGELRAVELDLDGRAPLEVGLAFESLCGAPGTNCAFHLYRNPDRCAVYLGTVESEPEPLEHRHRGMRDLLSVFRMGFGSWIESRSRWDGRRYRPVGVRECREGDGVEPVCD